MQTNAQKLWENAHKQLVALLRFLDQDYDEACEKANHPLESFSDDDLAYLIHVRLRALQGNASIKKIPDEAIEIKQSLKELSQKYADLEQTVLTAQELNKKLQAEKSALETRLSALRQGQKVAVSLDNQSQNLVTDNPGTLTTIPDWIKTWKESKAFENTSTAILVIGETGIALRPTILKMMAKRLSLSAANKNLNEALHWLMAAEDKSCPVLIEQIDVVMEQGSSSGVNQPAVLRLTKEGAGCLSSFKW